MFCKNCLWLFNLPTQGPLMLPATAVSTWAVSPCSNCKQRFGGFFWGGAFPASFSFVFVFSIQLTVNNVQYKCLPMNGFEPRTCGIGSDRSTNWASTTAPSCCYLFMVIPTLRHLPAAWMVLRAQWHHTLVEVKRFEFKQLVNINVKMWILLKVVCN